MRTNDPRHGTNAGYLTHTRDGEVPCSRCAYGRASSRKRIALDLHRGHQLHFSALEVTEAVNPWLRMGLSLSAVVVAARLGDSASGNLYASIRDGRPVRRGTYHALAEVTEDDFAGTAKINGSLTKRRVYSLMAIGHRVCDMPILTRGAWRTREQIQVTTARDIRSYYAEHEFEVGPNRQVEGRARNAGHKPPLAWDDPGTLGWPDAVPSPYDTTRERLNYRSEELLAEVQHLTSLGVSMHHVADQLGVTIDAIQRAGERAAVRAAS